MLNAQKAPLVQEMLQKVFPESNVKIVPDKGDKDNNTVQCTCSLIDGDQLESLVALASGRSIEIKRSGAQLSVKIS